MNTHTDHPAAERTERSARPIRRSLRLISSALLVLLLLAMLFGSSSLWALDLAMTGFWWIWSAVCTALVLLSIPSRRMLPLISLIIAICCAWPLVASRAIVLPRETSDLDSDDVSVLVFNSDMGNHDSSKRVLPFVVEQDADIAVFPEPVWAFYASVTRFGALDDVYPGQVERVEEGDNARILVLSRWEMSGFADEPLANADGVVCLVHRPDELGGAFVLVATHPFSPRTAERWARGNRSIDRVADRVRQLIEDGHRVVLCADLNAAPGSSRDRVLRRVGGVSRSKPLLGRWGSFPASWSVGRIAIDDVWCSQGAEAFSWRTIRAPGSDHRAIMTAVSISGDAD